MPKETNAQNVANDVREIISLYPGLIRKIGIFGSLARGDFNENSDIDLLVEYDEPPVFSIDTFDKYCGLCIMIRAKLAELYKRSVDIAHFEDDSLENLYDPDVGKEVIWI